MRERTFRKPTVRKLFDMQSIKYPSKIDEKFILKLIDSGVLVPTGNSYEEAVRTVEDLEEGCLALFSSRFRVHRQDADYGIKSLEDLVKIDSQSTLKRVSGSLSVPGKLTKEFAEQYRILPSMLIEESMERENIEDPPIGFYWVGTNGQFYATTWLRAVAGAEMQMMKQEGHFSGRVIDKTPYARNLRVRVSSRTEDNKEYEFTLFRLPIHERGEIEQFSDWINISHNSSDPDTSYRGGEHEQRVHPICLWSASTIFSFYDAMIFVKRHPEWNQFRINPFPIPTDEVMINYIDDLRLRSLILDEREGRLRLSVLNKHEIEKHAGAKTILRKYKNCWHHWGKKDHSYLYQLQ